MFGLITSHALEFFDSLEPLMLHGVDGVGHYLLANPAIAIFLCLFAGYLLGRVKIGSFTVGATVGTLAAGLILSFVLAPLGAFKIPGLVKSIFFTLFIFTIGYEVGPSFFRSLKTSGLKIILLSTFFAAVAFFTSIGLFKVLGVSAGEAAGVIAGALTQSAVLGTAGETIRTLMTGQAQTDALAQMPIAYAITYVFGTVGVIIFMKNIAPKLCGADLKAATRVKIAKTGFKENAGGSVISAVRARAFTVNPGSPLTGITLGSIESGHSDRLSCEAFFRNGEALPCTPAATVSEGDVLTFIGESAEMVELAKRGLTESADPVYLKITPKKSEVIITEKFRPAISDSLAGLGIVVESVSGGKKLADAIPGDCVTLVGPASALSKTIPLLGYAKDTGTATDVSFMSLGIVFGLLIGALCFKVRGIPVTLGGGGGALVGGLIAGWYQNRHSGYGLIPAATAWFLKSVGLNLFIAVVGLTAGSTFLAALKQMGVTVLLLGIAVTLIPHIASVLFGRFVLKLDPVDIIGGLCGAGTCTAALNGVIDETGSSVFAMGYTPGYAVGNVLITVLGPMIVSFLM